MTDENINIRTHDVNMAFKQVIDLAIQHKVDLIVHAGDGLNKWGYKQPHIFNFYMDQVKRATDHEIEWVEIAGNHNFAKKAGVGNELFKLGLLNRVHTIFRGNYEKVDFPRLNVVCHGVPSTFDQRYLNEELEKVAPVDGKYNIGIFHGGVSTISHYAENADRSLVVSLDQLKRCRMDYFALGDFHKDTDFGDGIRYSGSIERLGFGEIDNRPKVYLVEVNTETKERRETPLHLNVRPMFDIKPLDASNMDIDAITDVIRTRIKETEMKDAIVRFRITNLPKHLVPVLRSKEDEIGELAKEALYFKLELKDKSELSKTIRTGSDVEFEGVIEGFRSYMKRVGSDASYDIHKVTEYGERYLLEELENYEAN